MIDRHLSFIGRRFTRWTVLELLEEKCGRQRLYLCRCDCGTVKSVQKKHLYGEESRSCGCLQKEEVAARSKTKRKDLTGLIFGYLTIVEDSGIRRCRKVMYKCRCRCGNITLVAAGSLLNGRQKSCGCYKSNRLKARLGPLHPNWNPDLTAEDRKSTRDDADYWRWQQGVYKRDRYTCQCCGDPKPNKINAHHLYSYTEYPSLRYDLDNGVAVCEICHIAFHKKYGYGGNTKEQFTLFLGMVNGYN